MYITFEGRSGAGKTTAARHLNRGLEKNIVPGWSNYWNKWVQDMGKLTAWEDWKPIAAMVSLAETKYRLRLAIQKHQFLIVDSMFHFYIHAPRSAWGEMARIFESAFCDLLPIATIILDVPYEICRQRMIERDPTQASVPIDEPETGNPWFHYLSNRFDWVHLIDGTQPQQVVNQEVFAIIERSLIERGTSWCNVS